MIEKDRIRCLNDRSDPDKGRYVLYWMQQSQREAHNPALEYAVREANRRKQHVLVAFALMEHYPEANERHFAFMLEGLKEVAESLERRRIPFVLRRGAATEVIPALARAASMLVCDRGYLRHQRQWRSTIAAEVACPVVQIEGDVVVLGGPSRHWYHGVDRVLSGSSRLLEAAGFPEGGRINLTLRRVTKP